MRKVHSAPAGSRHLRTGSASLTRPSSRLQSRQSCRSSKSARLKEILNTGDRPSTVPNRTMMTTENTRNTFVLELPDDDEEFENPNAVDKEVERTVNEVKGGNNQENLDEVHTEGNFLPDLTDRQEKTRHVQLAGNPIAILKLLRYTVES